jgi:riboflavin synthase
MHRGAIIEVHAPDSVAELKHGESVAVNGVCLTAAEVIGDSFTAHLMPETVGRTTLGMLPPGAKLNLELAMPVDGRFGGHLVAGHVDGIGEIVDIVDTPTGAWRRLRIRVPRALSPHTAEKGSIAVDGVSLTIAEASAPEAEESWIEIELIPTTMKETNLGEVPLRMPVNLEIDPVARHLARLLELRAGR